MDHSPLSDTSSANISSRSVACLSACSLDSAHCKADVHFNEVQLGVAAFMDGAFGVVSEKSPPNPRPSSFLPCYLLGVLQFLVLYECMCVSIHSS